ncbi:MAG TPA: glycosyl hydrolase family 17 protein [Woeseiaceae bacterium]|nr:glycosyl hydrolase family 17 protein [Woeseiaceae bacterium]
MTGGFVQAKDDLLICEVLAISYSGYREGQHPDRGDGARPPSDAQVLEDLQLLVDHGFGLIRVYDTGEHTRMTLELIERHNLPIKVLLGIWLRAEVSNHEGCPWLDEPIPDEELARNRQFNVAEIERGIELGRRFEEIVVAVNVGNEALVDWNDHMVPVEQVIKYVRTVKRALSRPVTVAENYAWWIKDGAPLAAEVDFLGVHTYPVWEHKTIDEGLAYTIQNIEDVGTALPDKPIVILEAGWPSTAREFPDQVNEANQARHIAELRDWATATNVTVFVFEAFDEPWKGHPDHADGAEKHWGLLNVDRQPKGALQ